MSGEDPEERIRRKVREAPDKLGPAIQEAIDENPHILDGMKTFFVREIVKVGMAVGCFDMATVSLGLTLQEVTHTALVWLPISGALYAGTALILSRVMGKPAKTKTVAE